ncbi:MAG TPA: FkbM family methyltransferase [Xanthobacteraceae bacterium]|nr:FkbM family methyltransferase [Xanthobacteraceae bacterium]
MLTREAFLVGDMVDFLGRIKSATAPMRRSVAGILVPSQLSYSAQFEDRIALTRIMMEGIDRSAIRYLDIGAGDPVYLSNTYLFYRLGGCGVLVEPDARYANRIQAKRPRDVLVAAGVAFDERKSSEITLFTSPLFNTFSADHARTTLEQSTKWLPNQRQKIVKKLEVPLLPANEILHRHFSDGAPHFISIDAEGVDFEVLKSIDFTAFGPRILCVERQASIDAHLDVIGRDRYELIYQTRDNLMFARRGAAAS